ncbi:MAG: glycosyltransferase family 1 protein [Chlamydiae bacterium]|nr:glycosyltransferase family 1 protein [Chlamydiota bacterium]
MKLSIVTYGYSNKWAGGLHRYITSMIPFLEKKGCELSFYDGGISFPKQPGGQRALEFIFKGMKTKPFEEYYNKIRPDFLHIQAEFGVGVAARNFCEKEHIPYTAAYHTHLDKLVEGYHIPSFWIWPYLKWLYKPSSSILTHTDRIKFFLHDHGICNNIQTFMPGIDHNEWFYEPDPTFMLSYKRPYFVTMARISKEKNLTAFLELDLPGTKFVVGEGPYKEKLMKKYGTKAVFLPYSTPRKVLSSCDVFVIPSVFESLGLVILEAQACGLPVAGFPVMGPLDLVEDGKNGIISSDLKEAALKCLSIKKETCIQAAKQYSWEKTADAFLKNQIAIKK